MTFFFITLLIIGIFYFTCQGFKNTKSVVINTVEINKYSPEEHSACLKILHISDMHMEHISISPEKLYSKLQAEPIDLIALTGDFLDRIWSIPKLVPYLETFRKLNPKYGMYAVFGNHDYVLKEDSFQKLQDLLHDYGIKTMQNENDIIQFHGRNLNIIGIDDHSTNRSKLEQSYKKLAEGYNLVLTHDPNVVLNMSDYHFDYLLSGHFHGGQIYWPKPYHLVKMGRLVRMNMVKGLHSYQGKNFYISEGLGQTGVNIRIGSRPEITFHHIYLPPNERKESVIIAG